jgi:hypothetical protein
VTSIAILFFLRFFLLDINFLSNYLSYFYQVIVIWNICVTCIYFWNYEIMVSKLTWKFIFKFSVKYFNAWNDSLSMCFFKMVNICMGVFTSYLIRQEFGVETQVYNNICVISYLD